MKGKLQLDLIFIQDFSPSNKGFMEDGGVDTTTIESRQHKVG